jgi:cytoskeletal protein RodZ
MPAADGLTQAGPFASEASAGPRLRVFVSYSRKDTAFADEVVAGLEYDGGFEVFLDRHSIHEGEAWQERLGGLIAAADVIVFLLSKASAESELCRWEVDRATALSKRIVPALIEPVDGAAAPPALNALQYVRFDAGHSFMLGLAGLRRALRADLHWVREHTRLLTRAQEWDAAGRTENRLLSGPDIAAAKVWLDQRPQDAPPPLEIHRDYIAASEQAESVRLSEERQQAGQLKAALARSRHSLRLATGACVLAVGATIAAGYFWWQTYDSRAYAEQAIRERDTYIEELKAELSASATAPADTAAGIGAADGASTDDDLETLEPAAPVTEAPAPPAAEPQRPTQAPGTQTNPTAPSSTQPPQQTAPPDAASSSTAEEAAEAARIREEERARAAEAAREANAARDADKQRQIDPSIFEKAPIPYSRKK